MLCRSLPVDRSDSAADFICLSHSSFAEKSAGPFFVSKPLEKYKNLVDLEEKGSQAARGSNSLTCGSQTGRLPELRQHHVIIKISELPKQEFSEKCMELYKKGSP